MPAFKSKKALKRPGAELINPGDISLASESVPNPSTGEPFHSSASKTKTNTHSAEGIRDSEIRYRRLFESAQDGILILNLATGAITDVNPFLAELLGYTRADLLGKTLWDIGLPKDVEASKSAYRELVDKQYVRYEDLPLQTRGGVSISVEVVSNVYRVVGDKVIQCNIRDIRQRRDAEAPKEQIRQAQKMEAVGQLAGGLAHDFNNLLGVILGYCEILESQTGLPDSAQEMILAIQNAGESAKRLTQSLLAFSRRQLLQPVVMDLNVTVKRMKKMLSRLIGENIELVSSLADNLGKIKADPNQIEQVVMNLAINARDAMPGGGQILVKTANVHVDASYVRQHPSTEIGRYTLLSVSDTGIGMNMETQSHIFEPFFTTKALGQGTGLGLSTVFGIVNQSGGSITVHSDLGFGSTFHILFPQCEKEMTAKHRVEVKPCQGGTETILLVDDSAPLRGLTCRLLEDAGYRVLDSGDPDEALRTVGGHSGPLPLMITDVVMPVFSGPVLAERVMALRPGIKVLYISGYNDNSIDQLRVRDQDCAFLDKPFTGKDLLRKVRELLDA